MAQSKYDSDLNPAADLIRQKVEQLYAHEPAAKQELAESEKAEHRSKHQKYMHELSHSGRSLADIQTAWHNYYQSLPDNEKHQVWQEFYAEHAKRGQTASTAPAQPVQTKTQEPSQQHVRKTKTRSAVNIKNDVLRHVRAQTGRKRGGHLKSLVFGVACGSLVVIILLFSFFNERFIAPFITPSHNLSNSSIIIDPSKAAVGNNPEIVIPKINVEIPVVYTLNTIDEGAIETALENGVVHYATTSSPGELGNGAIFGHSSNNIFNPGKYKFAFVLLKRLQPGDTFYLQKDGKRYVYKVFDKKVVKPDEVSVLGQVPGHPATFTLITCDPPGTSINRLVVIGDQISPDPGKNIASSVKGTQPTPKTLPSNSPSLWSRFWGWVSS